MPVKRTIDRQFADAIAAFGRVDKPIVLAVSGGGDSTALMHLAARAVAADQLVIVSVDHGLREGSADEIAQVAAQARDLGLRHHAASWTWDGKGNLQAAARAGRWAALRAAASDHDARWVWMGHTQDDQVETALMRLARGSGVDGLTGMYPQIRRDGLRIGRPLLAMERADLRDWLRAEGIGFSDDPSNDDPRFDRIRARQLMQQLQSLGLTRKRLLQTIDHMQAAHVSLQAAARDFAQDHVRQDAGDLLLTGDVLDIDSSDAPRRVLAAAIGWVASREYRPRFDQLRKAARQVREGRTVTLAGVVMTPERAGVTRITREAAATKPVMIDRPENGGATWDRRWFLEGPARTGMCIRALGEGIQFCPDSRASGLPRMSLMSSPAVWLDDALVSAPLARLHGGWSARIVADFHSTAFAIED